MSILHHGGATATAGFTAGEFQNPSRRTPDHPPYAEMVRVALQDLAEENGSSESAISSYIKSTFNDLPWGHDRLLPYYLRKFVADGELTSPSSFRYQLPFSSPVRRRGRPRLYPNPNPNPNPNPKPKPSRLPSAFPRRRGRPPKVRAEDMPQRGRGRSRLRRGASHARRSGFRVSSSRGSKWRRKDSSIEKFNCDSAFFVDVKNGGCEQFDIGKGEILGGEAPLLLLDPGTTSSCLDLADPGVREEPPCLVPVQIEFCQDQSMLGEKVPLVTPEKGKLVRFLGSEVFEHDHGLSMQEDALAFMPPEKMRGRSRLRRGASSIGRTHTQRSGRRLPSSRGSKSKKDGTLVLEQGQFSVNPEQTDVSKGQFLGGDAPSLLLDPGTMRPCFASEQGKPLPFLASNQSMQEAASPFMPLRRGVSIGSTRRRKAGLQLPSSRVSKRRKGNNIEKLNCQSENSAFFNDIKNQGSECVVLDQGQPFVSPEQSDDNKGQFLGTIPPFLATQPYELVEGQQLLGEKLPYLAPEQTEFSQDQSILGEKLPLLTPEQEQGKPLPFLVSKVIEQTEPVQLPREKLPFFTPKLAKVQPFLAAELPKLDHAQEGAKGEEPSSPREMPSITTLQPGKVPPFLAPEFLDHDQEQASKLEGSSFMSTRQTERIQKQFERDLGLPFVPSEESKEGHDHSLMRIGVAEHKGGESVLMPGHDEDVNNAPVSSRKSKLHGRRRSLRLWFES